MFSYESFQLVSPRHRPGLAEVMAVALRVVSSSGHARVVMEGLFAHFFFPDRLSYAREDVLWFLKLANQQALWCHVEGHPHGTAEGRGVSTDEASKVRELKH